MSDYSSEEELHHSSAMKFAMRKLHNTGYMSDVIIKCQDGSNIKAHKCILAAHCCFFAGALNPEHNFKEADCATVEMPDDHPSAVRAMISFFYFGEYSLDQANLPQHKYRMGPLEFSTLVYLIAEKYLLWELRSYAHEQLFEAQDQEMNETGFLDILFAMSKIYDGTSDDHLLRDFIIGLTDKNRRFLHAAESKEGAQLTLLLSHPQFLLDLLWSKEQEDLEHSKEALNGSVQEE